MPPFGQENRDRVKDAGFTDAQADVLARDYVLTCVQNEQFKLLRDDIKDLKKGLEATIASSNKALEGDLVIKEAAFENSLDVNQAAFEKSLDVNLAASGKRLDVNLAAFGKRLDVKQAAFEKRREAMLQTYAYQLLAVTALFALVVGSSTQYCLSIAVSLLKK